MDGSYITLIAGVFAFLMIFWQRVEASRKRLARWFLIIVGVILMLYYTHLRRETVVAFLIALFVSFLFWLLIGRYNPVGSSDSIKVYGMDD